MLQALRIISCQLVDSLMIQPFLMPGYGHTGHMICFCRGARIRETLDNTRPSAAALNPVQPFYDFLICTIQTLNPVFKNRQSGGKG